MMNLTIKTASRKVIISFVALISIIFLSLITPSQGHAAPVTGFDAGNIIDNIVFTNSNSMSVGQIQAFLNSKVPVCDTNGTQTSEYGGGTRAEWAANASLHPNVGAFYPPFTCLKDYTENGLTSAQIIYNIAQEYQINPQVLIVLLQKEQGLVTDTWPAPYQYRSATGYGCPDNADCDARYYGLTIQLYWSATMFHTIETGNQNWSNPYGSGTVWYTPYVLGENFIYWSPNLSCGGSTVDIVNQATQALYNYTPYQPNQASLNAGYGNGDSCSSHGNRNFYLYFTDWFGNTHGSIYNGVDYSAVFDANNYLDRYSDLKASFGDNANAALAHFVNHGMNEGRQASSNFEVHSYRNRYQDLRRSYRTSLRDYYMHYITNGRREGRVATGNIAISGITDYNGVDYSAVYNFDTYIANYTDLQASFADDDVGAIMHFAISGMNEGRIASNSFSVASYKSRYYDLRHVFGNNLRAYYMHYINNGRNEGRIATGNELNGTSVYNGVDYSAVYNFNTYITGYLDLQASFGSDDIATIAHFINSGMSESRVASSSFNIQVYKANYADLRASFGDDLKLYYLHYITYGKNEGRVAV